MTNPRLTQSVILFKDLYIALQKAKILQAKLVHSLVLLSEEELEEFESKATDFKEKSNEHSSES